MNKKNAYYILDQSTSITKLARLCLKILNLKKTINIITENNTVAENISKQFWQMSSFIPHGIQHDVYERHYPILIIYDQTYQMHKDRDVIINFETPFILDIETADIVLWNCKEKCLGFIEHRV